MAIGIILGIILFIAAVGAFIWCGFCVDNGNGVGAGITGVIGGILVLAFILVPFSFHTVQTGELAVVKHLGKVTDVRDAGTNFDWWFLNKYEKYDAKVQNMDITTMAYSSDAQTMEITMTLQYQIMPDKVVDIATHYGSLAILQSRIESVAIEKTKATLSAHKAMDIIALRASISPEVEEVIKDAIDSDYFVKVNTVVLSNIDFSDAFEAAVEDKMIAEQAKLKADYENEKKVAAAEAEAEAKLKAAQAEIDIAKAEAEAKKIAAEGEAAANKIITDSITDPLLNKILTERWDGKLPNTYVGNGSDLGIILPNP